MGNYIEEIIAEYYKVRGFLVTTNYWIPFTTKRERTRSGKKEIYHARSWTDIDVLAKGKNELLIIQVKTTVNSTDVAKKVNTHFDRIEAYLRKGVAPDGKSAIDWWAKNKTIKRVLIYEDRYSPPSYLKIVASKQNAEVRFIGDYLSEILEYIEQKQGVKEESPVMRLLHFLQLQKLLVTNTSR